MRSGEVLSRLLGGARIDKTLILELLDWQAMERGEIRRVDPKRLALFIIEGSTAIVLQRITEDAPPPEEHDLDVIVDTILDGISFRQQKRSPH